MHFKKIIKVPLLSNGTFYKTAPIFLVKNLKRVSECARSSALCVFVPPSPFCLFNIFYSSDFLFDFYSSSSPTFASKTLADFILKNIWCWWLWPDKELQSTLLRNLKIRLVKEKFKFLNPCNCIYFLFINTLLYFFR